MEYLSTLDTALGFIYLDGRLYMVRNLLDNTYTQFGALIMRLNLSYCFGPLYNFPQGKNFLIQLDDETILLKVGGNSDVDRMRDTVCLLYTSRCV